MSWKPQKPQSKKLSDQGIELLSQHLKGQRIALLVTGGIAAYRTPDLVRSLRKRGADVYLFASKEALRFVTRDTLEWCSGHALVSELSSQAEHVDEEAFNAYLVAPATYNTLNKFSKGIADNLITTTLATALGRMESGHCKILLAPTMHGDMHNSILQESLLDLQKRGVELIAPRDEYGKHNIPETDFIVAEVIRSLSVSSLRGKKVLVTGGPTPVKVDRIRRLTNVFTGQLGLEIAREIYLRGGDPHFVCGNSQLDIPSWISNAKVDSYEDYSCAVFSFRNSNIDFIENSPKAEGFSARTEAQNDKGVDAAVFSAAVADFDVTETFDGKIKSDQQNLNIELKPTHKVVDQFIKQNPQLPVVSFKYEENISHEDLLGLAEKRIVQGHSAVIANRGEEMREAGDHVAHLVLKNQETKSLIGKSNIAKGLVDYLESIF